MRFFHPGLAPYAVWSIAALGVFYIWIFRKRRSQMARFAERHLLTELTPFLNDRKKYLRSALMAAAVFLTLVSLARPQWGFHWKEIKRKGLDIIIAIDTSKSMLAEDVKPNRLERSKLAVKDLVKKLKGDRIGLVAFAGGAFLQCPLTVDYDGFTLALDDLDTNTIPKGGTSLASAIYQAIESYGRSGKEYRALVIITDGEDHEGNVMKAAEAARKEGIRIFCIGIGTKEGEIIPTVDERNKRMFLKDAAGRVVKTRLEEDHLRKMAVATDGGYVRATGAEFGLDLIYEERLSKMEKREFESRMKKQYKDRFQLPLAMALLLLIAEPLVNEKKRLK